MTGFDVPDLLARLRIRAKAISGRFGDYLLMISEGMQAVSALGADKFAATDDHALLPLDPIPAPR